MVAELPQRAMETGRSVISTSKSTFMECWKALAWAILSARYSLFFPDERKRNYTTTFKSDPCTKQCHVLENNRLLDEAASRAWLNQLALDVRQKIRSRNIRSIVFWPSEPRAL